MSNSVAIFNIPDKNVLSSSIHFLSIKFLFLRIFVFYSIFSVIGVTNILNNDFYITCLFQRDDRFLFCNYKVTGTKLLSHPDNNTFFLVMVLVIFRVFNRKRREHLKLCYLTIFLIVILLLKFQIKDGFPFNFTSLQKCSTNEFLET